MRHLTSRCIGIHFEQNASKLLFLKEYIEMALKENPSRSGSWKGSSHSTVNQRSSVRRQSIASFRGNTPLSLDSLLDVFSYHTLSTLSDHLVHSVFVPHEKYSLHHSVPDQLRTMLSDSSYHQLIDFAWLKSVYGIDIDRGRTIDGGGRGYYDAEPLPLSSTPTQGRSSGTMASTPPQNMSRRNTSRVTSAQDLLGGTGTEQVRNSKGDEVSIGELQGIKRKIRALKIPPLSPDFGSLVQATDGRPYRYGIA